MSEKHCGDCRYCFPITKGEAATVTSHMSRYGRWQKVKSDVFKAILWALKSCGICAWQTKIVGKDDEGCEEHWRDKQ